MVYFCEGDDKEKLEWFKTINIAGEELTNQELRNAVYSGSWVTGAKKYFSKTNCVASNQAKQYLNGSSIRQEYLETAIKWKSFNNIEEYMAKNQHQPNANELWQYFQSVINWVEVILPPANYRPEMKGAPFGDLYNEYGKGDYDAEELEKKISRLMEDEDVGKKQGIYSYIFNRKEWELNIRAFSKNQKREFYEQQGKVCMKCKKDCGIEEMEAKQTI